MSLHRTAGSSLPSRLSINTVLFTATVVPRRERSEPSQGLYENYFAKQALPSIAGLTLHLVARTLIHPLPGGIRHVEELGRAFLGGLAATIVAGVAVNAVMVGTDAVGGLIT